MNLITVIENLQIEIDNNDKLGIGVEHRLTTEIEQDNVEISQLEAMLQNKRDRRDTKQRSLDAVRQEFSDRKAALAALIGGE